MLCAISGEAPREPVVSLKSRCVFEKRLIESHISEHHTDPVTGEDLTLDDVFGLNSPQVVTPRPPNLTSIPALLGTLQNEWDASALEKFTLRQQLAQLRQELSTALYENDAATRVIARLIRERDEAREALSNVTIRGTAASTGDAMQVDGQALPEELVAKVDETQEQLTFCGLFATRRKRPIPDGWATGEDISTYDLATPTESIYPGSSNVSIDASGDLVLFGGADGVAGVYSVAEARVALALKADSAVTATTWCAARAAVATSAGIIKIFQDGNEIAQVGQHAGAITSLSLHPSGQLLASVGTDKRFALHDLSTFKTVSQVYVEAEITCCTFHVDGLLFLVGSSDGKIRIFDIKTGSVMAELETGSPVLGISFSENGVWFAVVNKDSSQVSVWDIRKSRVIKVLEAGSPVENTKWDYTGQYLAIAGSGSVSVQQFTKASKSWRELLRKAVPAKDVAWGLDARRLIALTPEGGLSILSAS